MGGQEDGGRHRRGPAHAAPVGITSNDSEDRKGKMEDAIERASSHNHLLPPHHRVDPKGARDVARVLSKYKPDPERYSELVVWVKEWRGRPVDGQSTSSIQWEPTKNIASLLMSTPGADLRCQVAAGRKHGRSKKNAIRVAKLCQKFANEVVEQRQQDRGFFKGFHFKIEVLLVKEILLILGTSKVLPSVPPTKTRCPPPASSNPSSKQLRARKRRSCHLP